MEYFIANFVIFVKIMCFYLNFNPVNSYKERIDTNGTNNLQLDPRAFMAIGLTIANTLSNLSTSHYSIMHNSTHELDSIRTNSIASNNTTLSLKLKDHINSTIFAKNFDNNKTSYAFEPSSKIYIRNENYTIDDETVGNYQRYYESTPKLTANKVGDRITSSEKSLTQSSFKLKSEKFSIANKNNDIFGATLTAIVNPNMSSNLNVKHSNGLPKNKITSAPLENSTNPNLGTKIDNVAKSSSNTPSIICLSVDKSSYTLNSNGTVSFRSSSNCIIEIESWEFLGRSITPFIKCLQIISGIAIAGLGIVFSMLAISTVLSRKFKRREQEKGQKNNSLWQRQHPLQFSDQRFKRNISNDLFDISGTQIWNYNKKHKLNRCSHKNCYDNRNFRPSLTFQNNDRVGCDNGLPRVNILKNAADSAIANFNVYWESQNSENIYEVPIDVIGKYHNFHN